MLGEPEFFAPRAPLTGSESEPQTEAVGAASTAAKAILKNSTGGALYEFVASSLCHVRFGDSTVAVATSADRLFGTWITRIWIDPGLITHIRVIRSSADGVLSFNRVR